MQLKAILLIILLSISVLPSLGQAEPLLSVSVSKSSYQEGDTVVISGKVTTVIVGTPITIQIFRGGNLVEIAQLDVAQDGTFAHTISAQGPQWTLDGEYIVRASYGEGNVAETSFQFFRKETTQDTKIFEVNARSASTFDVEYTIRGGTVTNMLVDTEIFGLIVIIDSVSDGSITLKLPRQFIDAKKIDGTDDTFIILIDGIEVPYNESQSDSENRQITISFEEGDSDIEIIGTFVIPEFGPMILIALFASIAFVIFLTTKRQILMKI